MNEIQTEITDELNVIEPTINDEFSINQERKNIPLYISNENELILKAEANKFSINNEILI